MSHVASVDTVPTLVETCCLTAFANDWCNPRKKVELTMQLTGTENET